MSEAKRRQTQGSSAVASATAAPLDGEAHIYRRSTAVLAPRSLPSQGTQPQARLPGTWRDTFCVSFERALPAPCLMPKAARAWVASPPAGTALARATKECLPGRVRKGRDLKVYVTETETLDNYFVSVLGTCLPCPLRSR